MLKIIVSLLLSQIRRNAISTEELNKYLPSTINTHDSPDLS